MSEPALSGQSRPRRRRWRRVLISLLVLASISVAALAVLVASGGKQLVDGTILAQGRVTTAVSRGFIAAYIVELANCLALVDAALDPAGADIRTRLDEMGRSPAEIGAIFLTHGHGDHIAGARAFPDATVFAMEADADLIAGERTAGNLLGKFRETRPTGITVDRTLDDDQVLDVCGSRVEVFAVPGHTRGSAAYLIHGVLFLGDAAGASAEDSLAAAPPVFSWDRSRARSSLHRLAERLAPRHAEFEAMAFGHQGPLTGIDALLAWHEDNQ